MEGREMEGREMEGRRCRLKMRFAAEIAMKVHTCELAQMKGLLGPVCHV